MMVAGWGGRGNGESETLEWRIEVGGFVRCDMIRWRRLEGAEGGAGGFTLYSVDDCGP